MKRFALFIVIFVLVFGKALGTITVTNPTAGAVWCIGSTCTVTWTYSNIPDPQNAQVRVILREGSNIICASPVHIPLTQGTYGWTLNTSTCPGLVPGEYYIRVRIVDGEFGDSPNVRIEQCLAPIDVSPKTPVLYPRQDLVVGSHTYTPQHPDMGDQLEFRARIVNQGNGDTVPANVDLRIVGPEGFQPIDRRFRIPGLGDNPQNNSNEVFHRFRASKWGIYKFTVKIDTDNEQGEKDETNNEKEFHLGVSPLPDLVVCMLDPHPTYVGVTKEIPVHVRNLGPKESPPCKLRVTIPDKGFKDFDVPRLGTNEVARFSREPQWSLTGTKRMKAVIDVDGTVKEINEDNNEVITSIKVKPAIGSKFDTGGLELMKCSDSRIEPYD